MPILKNPRHERFCHSISKGISGPDAYIAAGYNVSPAVASACASRLLTDAKIQLRLEELQGRAADRAVKSAALSREWVLSRLMKHADVCLGDEKITAVRAVKSRVKDESGGFQDVVATVEITITERDATAANRALELLGREHGMFVERKEVGKPGDFDNLSDDDLRSRLYNLTGRTRRGGTDRPRIEPEEEPQSLH